jgi:hypothetical protein
MRRPLLLGRARGIYRLGRFQPLRERIHARAQRTQLLLLPIDDIALLKIRALQERNFRFDPLEMFAVHTHSVTL